MNQDLAHMGGTEDLRKKKVPKQVQMDPELDEEALEEEEKVAEPAKGILKMGADAKFSQGKTQADREREMEQAELLEKEEEQRVVEATLIAYLKAMQQQAAAGFVVKTVRSLEMALRDKHRVYANQPKNPSIWRVAKALADIALKHAVKSLNNRQLDTAYQYMKMVQKHTEPIAGSEWSLKPEWILLRKNLHKNFALYHQKNVMWQQAFDNLKLALRLENQLNLRQEATNTCLTCAILQQKMKNYGASIDYAQQTQKSIEQDLGITKGQPLSEVRYQGKELDRQRYNDKMMTQFAIAHHIIGKNLLHLDFVKESKHFITKAHYIVTKMLVLEKKADLQLAIQMDMKTVLEKTRYLTEMEALEAKAAGAKSGEVQSKKKKLVKEHVLTDDDIERSLSAIKSGLATADGPDAVQDKYMEIEGEIKQLEDKGELDYAQFQEEFKEIFEDQDGNQLLDRDEQLEDKIRDVKKAIQAYADPDEQETAEQPAEKGAVKKQKVQRQENQADKRETDPEYLLRLEDYKRAQEQLRLKQEGFAQRQKEFAEKKQKRQQAKDEKMAALDKAAQPFLKKNKEGSAAIDQLSQVKVMEAKQAKDKLAQAPSRFNKLQKYQSQQRTKNAPLNLARIGAQYDVPGVHHVAQKGANKFFIQRKKNILSLNRAQYQSNEQDKVELGAGEYQQMLDEQNDADGVQTLDEKELGLEGQKGIVGGRDKQGARVQVFKANAGQLADAVEDYKAQVAKIQLNDRLGITRGKAAVKPTKSQQRSASLFQTGMKSTKMVLDTVQERVYKPPRPGSMATAKLMTAQENKDAQRALAESSEAKLEALGERQKKLRRRQSDKRDSDSSEERRRREYEGLNNGRAGTWNISEEGKETLAREDRNYLQRQKPYEQLKKEDPDNRPVWSHDEAGNKLLMRDADGNIVDTFAAPEEEEEDPMFEGLRNLIKGTKEKAEQERIAKGEIAGKLLETEKEHKERVVREKAEKEEQDRLDQLKRLEEAEAMETKKAARSKSPTRKGKLGKNVKFQVMLDDKGVERGKGYRAGERLSKPRGRQAGQKSQAYKEPPAKSRRLRAEAVQDEIEGKEKDEKSMATATHSAQTYYDKEKDKRDAARAAKPRGVTGLKEPEAKDLYSLGVTGFSKDRLEALSKPVNKDLHKIMKEYQDKMEPEKASGADKAERIMSKLEKTNRVDFEDYVDRDVPPIRGDTGQFSKTIKTSKGLAAFETQHQDPNGLFENLVKEGPGETFAVKNAKEKLAKSAIAGLAGKKLRQTDTHLPAYMKAARQAQMERAGGNNKARTKAFRKAMNDNTVQQMGLKSHIPFGAPQYLNLRELRDLEYTSARQIQNLARGYFTKKWYLNYVVRKKLGVPFSGIEFAQNPFLRQFNKPNTHLNRLQQIDSSNMLTAIPTPADMQLSTIQIKRLRNRQQENNLRIKGRTKMPDNTDESRLIAHKMKKGTTSQAIIAKLQEDFLADGLDAYDHFKRMQVGIDHDEDGEPQKRVIEEGKEIIEPLEDQETRDAKKQIYGVFKLPNWIGDRTETNKGGSRGGIIDTSESDKYILRKENEKFKKRGQGGGGGPTLAALMNHVVVNEPLPHKQGINPEGGGPEGGGGGPGGGGDYSIQQALRAARDPDGEMDFFQPQRYQEFSREPIVFYKRVINDQKMLRWTIKAGEAFKREVGIHTTSKEIKYFIPIWLVGQVLGSHQVVYYKMNLELIKISDGIATHLENFKFETIWPFILYLFNYWVKNQASLMIKSQTHPQRQIYQNELQKINRNQNYIEFFQENEQFANELEKIQQLDNLQLMMPDDKGEEGQQPSKPLQRGGKEFYIKSEFNNFLDFSSEIHYDDRFDEAAFKDQHQAIGSAIEGQHRIDRSKPEGERANTKVQSNANRQKLFEEYRRSVEEYEKTKKKVQFTQEALDAQIAANPEAAAREREMEVQINKLVEAEKFMINIADFVKEHYLYLPNNKQDSMYRLLKALAQKAPAYSEVEKRDGINKHSLTQLNEERRRRLKLAPLTPIDYNCMERAAQKIKLIVDCLMLSRRQSGQALIAKDMIVAQMLKQQQARHLRHQKTGKKLSRIHHKIYQHWGMHVQMEPQFNAKSAQVVQSLQKIRQYQQSKHITTEFQDGPADGVTAAIQQELDLEDQHQQALQQEVFDQQMAELDGALGGPGGGPVVVDPLSQGDQAAARHQRIVNEYENYIEDQSIIDQQVIRLPEEVSNKEVKLFMSTIAVRKIKSNIENILQILWEREAEVKRKAALANLIFTADQPDDKPIFGNFTEEPSAYSEGKPISIPIRPEEARQGGDQNAQNLMDQAPKIVRLQSKICRIISDHEDVKAFDAQHYPPGTDKVPKLIALDVEQEKLQKSHTNYKSYAEFQVCTAINRQDMWDDSVNIQWEVLEEFFMIFGIKWDPISTMKRGRFRKEESFLINQFFCRCLYLDHNNCQALSFDMKRLDFGQIKYDEIFLWLPDNVPKQIIEKDSLVDGDEKAAQSTNVYTRQLFEKYIQNEEFITRFDESDYDKLIFPFYDESDMTFERLFKFDRKVEFMDWIVKFQDPEEQKEIGKVQRKLYPKGMGTTTPIYMVEELALQTIKDDAAHMFNLSLSKFNQRQDDLLWLGKLQLAAVIKYSKIEPYVLQQKQNYNVKIEYFLRGMIPRIQIKAFDTYAQEVLQCNTINKKHIKMIIRICNQQSDKMIRNQLESMIQIRATKLTVGRTLYLNFGRKLLQTKNLGQNHINMLICHEALLQRFITNQNAAKNFLYNSGIKQFKGLIRNLTSAAGSDGDDGGSGLGSGTYLVNITQYDMFIETLLYYDPMLMIHGNKHLGAIQIKDKVLDPIQRKHAAAKSFDRVKIWKINLLEMSTGLAYNVLLSLHDIVQFYESELPLVIDLENEVGLPNLLELLRDYLSMMKTHRSLLGRIVLWKLPQYKRPTDPKTGRMLNLNPDELYRMKILEIYKRMLSNIQEQLAFQDGNALPLSLDSQKAHPDQNKQKLPNLCLRSKTVREKNMPIFENNSKQLLKVFSQDMQVIVQRPKVFRESLKRLQFVLISVILHPSMECWIWQLYFPRNQRTFSVTLYSSDLFALDDEILNDEYILQAENMNQALWAHLINICQLVRNPIGDIMIQIQNFKEPLKEILFQDIVYNQNAKDMMFMEVVLKNYSNYVTDVESPFPAISIQTEEVKRYTFAVRAFSLTRNIWIKDFQPFFEVIGMLKRENYYVNNLEYFYYTMLRDTACLLSHKIIFSEAAKTQEVKKRKLVYDIKSIIGRRAIFREVSNSIERTGSPKKDAQIGQYLDDANRAVLEQEEHEQTELTRMNKIKNRPDWENVVLLNRIIYQAIISQNPVQMCTIIYNEVKDVFVYRLYRAVDSSIFERQITSSDVIRTCAPHLRAMLNQGLAQEVGQRIAQHYMANILVASVLEFYKIR